MAKNIYRILGERVREERGRAGYTQEELGEKAGLTGAFVAHIERSTKHATLDAVEKIARAFGIPVTKLLKGAVVAGETKDEPYLNQFARLIRSKTPKQKKALLQVTRVASNLISK